MIELRDIEGESADLSVNSINEETRLLGNKRIIEKMDNLFFPQNFRENKEIMVLKNTNCYQDIINRLDWNKLNDAIVEYSERPLNTQMKFPKLSSNMCEYILSFMHTKEFLELINVNSTFKKIILRNEKWFGLCLEFLKIFQHNPCKVRHGSQSYCLKELGISINLDHIFSYQVWNRITTCFQFVNNLNNFPSCHKNRLIGETVSLLGNFNSNELKINYMEWDESKLTFLPEILNSGSCFIQKISLNAQAFIYFNPNFHKFEFIKSCPKIKYFSFNWMILHETDYSELIKTIFVQKSHLKTVSFFFAIPNEKLEDFNKKILINNLKTFFNFFIDSNNVRELVFETKYYFFKISKDDIEDREGKLKMFNIFQTIANDLERRVGYHEIFLTLLSEFLYKNKLSVPQIIIMTSRKKFLKVSNKLLKIVNNTLEKQVSLSVQGPLIISDHDLINKIKIFQDFEYLELSRLVFDNDQFMSMLKYFDQNKKIKNVLLEDLVVSYENENNEMEFKTKVLYKELQELKSSRGFSMNVPYCSDSKSLDLVDEEASKCVIKINGYFEIHLS
jgi:hypothetical protein